MNMNMMSSLNYNYKQKLPYISSELPQPIQSPSYSQLDHSSSNSNSMKIDSLKLGIGDREVEGRRRNSRDNDDRYTKPDTNLNFISSLDNYSKHNHLPMNTLNKLSNPENLSNGINIVGEMDGVNTQNTQNIQNNQNNQNTKKLSPHNKMKISNLLFDLS